LSKKIEYNTNFDKTETMPSTYVTVGENSKSNHFFIHRVWHNPSFYNSFFGSIENVIFEYSYINKLGEIDDRKIFIAGKALHEMMVGCNLKKGPFFVYDKTPFKDSPERFHREIFTNNTTHNFFSQNTNLSLSQNSIEFYNPLSVNTFSQGSNFNPVVMKPVNVPDIHIHQSFPNTKDVENNNVEANSPFRSNMNSDFASM